ncbi:hypothetical protein EUX98_g5965 [Antrodiella citrinella]|uniref:Polyketide synthase phosphopantetheine-binding domain-containing protein n=1 Tax=Antrodiella citrinella TaxID=2447956 RepID=A0A4S4MQI0_9APHY|nr:hypothetical protein EUX98_g5965 [Antrodiella citrinella]
MAPPTFHAMGIVLQLFEPLASSQPVALFTPQAPAPPTIPSAQYVIDVARAIGCKILICAPTFLETWIHSPEAVKLLASMIVVIFAGGPVSKATGDKLISAGVNIRSVYGATETAGCCDTFHLDTLDPTPDWEWLSFKDGVKTSEHKTNEHFHPAVENLPDVPGYATKDLFIQHPSNPELWRIVGRIDDVIVLGSAEKIVPLAQENYLQSLPFISGAIMFGRGRIQPGVLLEPKPDYAFDPKDTEALAKFRNQVWPYVVEANKLGPQFARVFKEMILATSPDKPLSRAAKGTTQRRAVYNQYAQEIDDLYNTVEESSDAHGVSAPHSWSPEAVLDWLTDHATSVNEGKTPSTTQDLFEQGFDSLSATYLRNRIIGAFRSSPDPFIAAAASSIPADIVFANPTLQWLASVVANLADPSAVWNSSKTHAEEVEDMVATYTKDLPIVTGKRPIDPSEGLVVVLTGSTGALGSHLLASLLKDDRIRKVYTLDRAEHIQERQQLAFEDRLLPLELLKSDKLRALTVNAGRADLGLDADILGEIKSNITHVIHNAWKVDFNLSLSSFESNIASTRRLIDIVISCENAVRFFFTSSISSTISSDTKHPVPERVNEDPGGGGPLR